MPAPAHKTSTAFSARRLRALLAFAFAIACIAVLPGAAGAVQFDVDTSSDSAVLPCATSADDDDCSLRSAIIQANANGTNDNIVFKATYVIQINSPLPSVTKPLIISAYGKDVVVTGSGSYTCAPNVFAIDITADAAIPTTILGLPFNAVCGRAIKSDVPVPTVQVGPRRFDNTVSVNGSAGAASTVDLFNADSVVDGEADTGGFIATLFPSGGVYSYTPVSVPGPADAYTATAITPDGSSDFAVRAHTPTDLTSPLLNSVVATSISQVRLDFNEALNGSSAQVAAFALGMANVARPIVGASVNGNSLYLESNLPWSPGEAGAISMTGNGRVADAVGNELLGQPTAPVYAGPGEIDGPVISNFKLSPNRFCQRKSSKCKRGSTYLYISLNKPARVIFKVARGTSTTRRRELVTFVHRLKAGKNKVKFDAVVSGRTLPAQILTIRAVAQDVARTLSAPVDTPIRIVKSNRDL